MDPTSTNPRVQDILRKIVPHLHKKYKILDIGSGSCEVAKSLRDAGYDVTPLDIVNKSFYPDFFPTLYDGKHLPFADNSFDIVLLITVLHHTKQPVEILREAARVAPRIIVMEDLYRGMFQKYMTFAMDSVTNREFFGHPHTNMTREQWEKVFQNLNLKIIDANIHDFWRFFTSGTFYLEKG
jgi:ubiquinone/menaquinone biosynthesis C-methylase UbiE